MSARLHPWNLPTWAALQLPHRAQPAALLLAGPRGVGKSEFALSLAQALLCHRPAADGHACGACQPCRLFLGGNHPDFRLLQEAGQDEEADGDEGTKKQAASPTRWIRVDQVRDLSQLLALRPHLDGRRVVLIQPADRLHPSAANALLKVLEEPPAGTHFILVTASPARLPMTVLSRCVRIQFRLPEPAQSTAWLAAQGVERAALALAQAGYAPLAARELDNAEYWSKRERLIDQVLATADFDPVGAWDRMAGEDVTFLVAALQRWGHDLLLARAAGTVRYNPDRAQILHELATRSDLQKLAGFVRNLQSTARFLEHPLNPRLVAERCLIEYKRALN
jgi:DNA polymerase-3 subunit delta'